MNKLKGFEGAVIRLLHIFCQTTSRSLFIQTWQIVTGLLQHFNNHLKTYTMLAISECSITG